MGKAAVEFLRGRFKFGGAKNSAPFAGMVAVYLPRDPALACARCGKGFDKRRGSRTCSDACRQALYRERVLQISVTKEAA